jgi:hypothetical protein
MSRVFLFALAVLSPSILLAVPADVSFTKPAAQVARFDFVEISATVSAPDATNPFEDASLSGSLETADGSHHWAVDGFWDSSDGALFRIRFMASLAGDYKYSVTYEQSSFTNPPPADSALSKLKSAASSPSIPSTRGTSSGREPVSITSSTEPRRIGWQAFVMTTPFASTEITYFGTNIFWCVPASSRPCLC